MSQISDVVKFLDKQLSRLDRNLSRARGLVKAFHSVAPAGTKASHANNSDILRAATVFTHASLEDFLRALSEVFLPNASESVLNEIPLVGNKGRNEKFYLGRLSVHRGKTIDGLINESIREYLLQTNYNNTTEIASLLASFSLELSDIKTTFPAIDELMERRHQIVHRGDNIENNGKLRATKISPKQVTTWIEAVHNFSIKVLAQCAIVKMDK